MICKSKILILALLLTVTGCGIFDTRDPENPAGTSNIWNPPANPRAVLDNISLFFASRDGVLYMKSFAQPGFADSVFKFQPDFSSPSYDSTLFSAWGYDNELQFILSIFAPDFLPVDSACSIIFNPENEPPGEFYPEYRENYIIELHHINPGLPLQFSGRADIRFDRNHNGDWVIIEWNDENSGGVTLTELKSAVSN